MFTRTIRFKFGTYIQDGPSLRADYKTTPKWAWPRDLISKFWVPLITFERIEKSASNLIQTEDGPLHRVDHKMTPEWAWPGSRDPVSKCWDPLITSVGAYVIPWAMDVNF